jgi:hypothetical protein
MRGSLEEVLKPKPKILRNFPDKQLAVRKLRQSVNSALFPS